LEDPLSKIASKEQNIWTISAESWPRRTFVAESAVLMTRRRKQAWPNEIQPCPKCDILG
jgi:hypothetical protein